MQRSLAQADTKTNTFKTGKGLFEKLPHCLHNSSLATAVFILALSSKTLFLTLSGLSGIASLQKYRYLKFFGIGSTAKIVMKCHFAFPFITSKTRVKTFVLLSKLFCGAKSPKTINERK